MTGGGERRRLSWAWRGLSASAVAACATAVVLAQSGAAQTTRTPLKEALARLKLEAVWANFYALTRIPRPSGHEQAVSGFVADFGRRLGLETTVDSVGNVLIRKPATAGMERRESVALQAHLDMVPQKAPGKAFDFEKDPIEAFVEGGWVKADGTTLGGDDGIGVATIMAIL
jgi:dipeptidase D